MAKQKLFILATEFVSNVDNYSDLIGEEYRSTFIQFKKENKKLEKFINQFTNEEEIDDTRLQKMEQKRRKDSLEAKIKKADKHFQENTWKYRASGDAKFYHQALEKYEEGRQLRRKKKAQKKG